MKADRKLIEQIVAESVRRVLAEKRYQMPNGRWEDDDYYEPKWDPFEFKDLRVDYNIDTCEMTQGAPKSDGVWTTLYFKVTDWEDEKRYDYGLPAELRRYGDDESYAVPTNLEFQEWDDVWKVVGGKVIPGAEGEFDDFELSEADIKKATEIANENIREWGYDFA